VLVVVPEAEAAEAVKAAEGVEGVEGVEGGRRTTRSVISSADSRSWTMQGMPWSMAATLVLVRVVVLWQDGVAVAAVQVFTAVTV
jgi:hypothetical protein